MTGPRVSHRTARLNAARANIGRRCHWRGEDVHGTITDVAVERGGSAYVIAWDDGAPDWWGARISTATLALVIL